MATNVQESSIGMYWGKVMHWTHTAKGRLTLHSGDADKCRRVHRDSRGQK